MARTPYWADTLMSFSVASGATNNQDLLSNLSPDERRGITLVRTIMTMAYTPSPTSGVVGTQIIDLGIGIASVDAFAAGALPDVQVESDRPPRGWIMRDRTAVLDDATDVANITFVRGDFRTKRRIDDGDLFLQHFSTARTGTPFTVAISGIVRVLYLLP